MTDGTVIMLLGISGVGKTTAADFIAAARPELIHLSAGALLRGALRATGESLRTDGASAVRGHQGALAEALRDARSARRDRPVLLEAHAVIDNDRELVVVPVGALRGLGIGAILHLVDDPALILQRRSNDAARPRPSRTVEAIAEQQTRSIEVAERYVRELSVPIAMATPDRTSEMLAFVDGVISSSSPIPRLRR